MPKNKDTNQPSRLETAPPGLLMVADIITRIPGRAEALIAYEIDRRERERVLMQETKNLLSWHPWHMIRFLILSGAVAFAVTWLFSVILVFAKLYNQTVGSKLGIPFLGETLSSVSAFLPKQIGPMLSDLPNFGALESFFVALGVVFLIALVKVVFIFVNWKRIKVLSQAEQVLTEELKALGNWKNCLLYTSPSPRD